MKNRGSEWRKWDLHLHSMYNNIRGNSDYNGITEEKFIEKIQEEELAVIGLTNYINFSDKDFELAESIRKKGVTVFLNLELRLTNINNDSEAVDYHIIFSDELSQDKIKNVLSNIDATVGVTRKKLNTIITKDDYSKAVVDFENLQNILSSESLEIKGKYLTGFLSRGHGNSVCGGSGRSYSPYEEIVRKSDIVIHSSTLIDNLEKDRNFWLGKSPDGNKYIRPLLQTSDAHCLDEIGFKKKEVQERDKEKTGVFLEDGKYFTNIVHFTWIKADTTFNGLKQIIYEPEERIRYSKDYPDQKSDYLIIDSLKYGDGKFIFLNSGLNAIIGGRSTGKSTLLNSIAKYQENKNILDKHFVLPDEFVVEWRDGEINSEREVEFIPQEFMVNISEDSSKLNKLLQEIIIKRNMDKEEKNYKEKVDAINDNISKELNEYFNVINSKNNLIKPEGDIIGVNKKIQELNNKVNLIRLKNKFGEEENEEYKKICSKLNTLENNLTNLEKELEKMEVLSNLDFSVSTDLSNVSDKNRGILEKKLIEIKNKSNDLWKETINEINININKEKSDLWKEIEKIKESNIFVKGKTLESKSIELKKN